MLLSLSQNHHFCEFYLFSNDLFIDVIGKHRTWAKYWTIHWGHHSCRDCTKTLKITRYPCTIPQIISQYWWYNKIILCKFYSIVVENCCNLSKLTLVSYKEHGCMLFFLYQISLLSSIDCHCNLRLCEFGLLSLIFSQLVHNYCKLE